MYGVVNQSERMSYHNGGMRSSGTLSAMESVYAPRVRIGDVVVIKYLGTDEKRAFRLTGDCNGGFERGAITVTSPMGSAVFSKTVGRVLEVRTPVGLQHIQIIEIRKAG